MIRRAVSPSPTGPSLPRHLVRRAPEALLQRHRRRHLGAGVTRLLADPAKGFYVVATDGARVIGQIMVTFDWRDGNWWWLQSVYVAPDARRRGVFRALFEEVRARANRQEVCGLRLYVERENHVAQGTYSGLGMKRAPYFVYQLGQE